MVDLHGCMAGPPLPFRFSINEKNGCSNYNPSPTILSGNDAREDGVSYYREVDTLERAAFSRSYLQCMSLSCSYSMNA